MTILFRLINLIRQLCERRWPVGSYRDQLADWTKGAEQEAKKLRLVKGHRETA